MVKCNECQWEGEDEDLKYFVDMKDIVVSEFLGCPNCRTDEYLEYEKEDENE